MQKFECLDQIIGVTKDYCQCLHGQIPDEEFQKNAVSKSGLYLDDVEGGISLRTIARVDKCKSFYELLVDSIENSKKFFKADLLAMLNLRYKMNKTNFVGEVGRPTFTGSLPVNKRLQFLKIMPESEGILNVERIRVFLNKDVNTKVWIVQANEGESFGNIVYENDSVQSSSMIINLEFHTPLMLPLKNKGLNQNYYFVYEKLDSDLYPRDIKTSCGCTGGDAYAKHLSVYGGEADNFSDLILAATDKFTHGVSLSVKVNCEFGSIVCNEFDENDAISQVSAFALMYKAAELVMEDVKSTNEVNRYTMLQQDELRNRRNHFKKEYSDRLKYLSEVVDLSSSDCFICQGNAMYLGNILG